jgi:putative membrane protein
MGILVLVIVGFGIYWIFKGDKKCFTTSSEDKNSALDLLNDRFAKGEIDEDTYRKMKEVIKG